MASISTRIASVAVYRQGAIVTRQGELPPNQDLYHIDGLPLCLEDGSVRVYVDGKEPTDVRVEWALPQLDADLKTVSDKQLGELAQQCDELRDRLRTLSLQRDVLARLQPELPAQKEGDTPRSTPIATWLLVLDWKKQAAQALDRREDALNRELVSTSEELNRLQRAQRELESGADAKAAAASKRVAFRLTQAATQPLPVRIDYRVPGARWVPSYELRVARGGAAAELSVRAFVVQATGEAWTQVALSLSTASLDAQSELSELHALRIGRAQPPPRPAFRPPPADTDLLFAGYDAALQDRPARPDAVLPPPPAPPRPAPKKKTAKGSRGGPPGAPMAVGASFGGPPEASMAAPMPPPAPAAKIAAPMMQAAPRMARARSVAMEAAMDDSPEEALAEMSLDLAGGAPPADMESEPEAVELVTPPPPRYTDLRMAASTHGRRGKLQALGLEDTLLASASGVRARIAQAAAVAQAVNGYSFPSGTQPLDSTAGNFDYRYDAQGKVDVPTDGRAHNLPLLTARAPVSLLLVVVPRESTDAVRIAQLDNPLGTPLLGGPVDVYWDDEFLVQAPLWTTPAGGRLSVGLGVEPALKVARNVAFEEKTAGLLRGKVALEHRVTIELASRLEREVDVEVREAIPVPQPDDDDTDVSTADVTPQWETFAQGDVLPGAAVLRGGKRWKLKLTPGRDEKLVYTYSIRIDGKRELVGGNRRA